MRHGSHVTSYIESSRGADGTPGQPLPKVPKVTQTETLFSRLGLRGIACFGDDKKEKVLAHHSLGEASVMCIYCDQLGPKCPWVTADALE